MKAESPKGTRCLLHHPHRAGWTRGTESAWPWGCTTGRWPVGQVEDWRARGRLRPRGRGETRPAARPLRVGPGEPRCGPGRDSRRRTAPLSPTSGIPEVPNTAVKGATRCRGRASVLRAERRGLQWQRRWCGPWRLGDLAMDRLGARGGNPGAAIAGRGTLGKRAEHGWDQGGRSPAPGQGALRILSKSRYNRVKSFSAIPRATAFCRKARVCLPRGTPAPSRPARDTAMRRSLCRL